MRMSCNLYSKTFPYKAFQIWLCLFSLFENGLNSKVTYLDGMNVVKVVLRTTFNQTIKFHWGMYITLYSEEGFKSEGNTVINLISNLYSHTLLQHQNFLKAKLLN